MDLWQHRWRIDDSLPTSDNGAQIGKAVGGVAEQQEWIKLEGEFLKC